MTPPASISPTQRRNMALVAVSLIVVITLLHYGTGIHHHDYHNVFRRLYYLPILIAAFAAGLRGGLAAAFLVCLLYTPHAFFIAHRDPSPDVDKLLEMLLFFVVGALTGWLVNQRDHAHRKIEATLAERDELERQLIRAGKLSALGEIASGLAHEIRNPLASILGSAETLGAEFPEEHRKYRISQLLMREIERLDRVIKSFLEFARPAQPRAQELSMAGLLEDVRDLIENHGSTIPLELPEACEGVLFADPDQAKQVLLNLLLNAIEALEGEGVIAPHRIRIRVEERVVGGGASYRCVGVEDTGPGIPEELLESVFDPYFTTKAQGTGLGLSLSSRIMEKHRGFLDIESSPGANTVWACFPTRSASVAGGLG